MLFRLHPLKKSRPKKKEIEKNNPKKKGTERQQMKNKRSIEESNKYVRLALAEGPSVTSLKSNQI